MLTQERLKERLHYDPDTGIFTWRVTLNNAVKKGFVAGYKRTSGYRSIVVDGKKYFSHRLAWLYIRGTWPAHQIDHINNVKDDNRICNLRESTHGQNQHNVGKRTDNTSGYKGVTFCRALKKYKAQIQINRKNTHLGYFVCPKEAHAAYCAAAEEHHGEFANDGTGDNNE